METNAAANEPRGNPGIVDVGVATRFRAGRSGNPGGGPIR
jgi:hypothetical protein